MMKKRLLALVLCLATAIALIPAMPAEAAVLPGMTSKIDYDNTDPNRYTIEIDLVNQIITVYEGAIGGPIVLQSLCTTGNEENPTGAGTFKLGQLKERFGYFVAFGQYAQYWTQVVRGIYIHSVMYNSKKLSSMSRTAYRQLGENVSHGCVRVLPHVAQWIFYNCPPGTTCKIDRKKAANPELVKELKAAIPSYSDYVQPTDTKADPAEIPAICRYDNVPLRTGFSNSRDTTVATLSRGQKMTLLQLGSDWCKAKLQDGTLGYVKTQYILCYPDAPVQTQEAYTATKKTYVYASMSTGSKKLATIPKGGEAAVVSNPKKGWWYGSYNGVEGYLRTKYVVKSTALVYPTLDTAALVPAATAAPAPTPGSGTSGGISIGGSTASPTPVPTPYQGSVVTSGTRVKEGTQARMRTAESTRAAVIALIDGGTPVTILSISETGWYYCTANGYTGYMHSSCLIME